MADELSAAAGAEELPAYLTAAQVGAMLQVSSKSISRWQKADPSMPALKIGGTVRFPRERMERWLREREQGRGHARSVRLVPPRDEAAR